MRQLYLHWVPKLGINGSDHIGIVIFVVSPTGRSGSISRKIYKCKHYYPNPSDSFA